MEITNEVVVNATGIMGAIGAIVFGASKAIKTWSADRGDIQKYSAEADLFQRMSEELKRLAATNQAQEKEIQELRVKFSELLNDFTMFRIDSAKRDAELIAVKERLKRYEP